MMEDKEDEHRLENKLQAWQLGRVNLLLVQMGRALGLFEVLFEQGPLTVEELAQATELQERYVKEWLHGCAAAGVVTYLPTQEQFGVDVESFQCLNSSAVYQADLLEMCANVSSNVEKCFRQGGGVPYSCYPGFAAVESRILREYHANVFYSDLKLVCSNSGIPLLEYLEKEGSICMDVGCGSGFALCELAEKFPSCSFVGVDLLADAIEAAKGVHRQTLTNILRQQTPSLSPSLLLSLPLSFLLIRV